MSGVKVTKREQEAIYSIKPNISFYELMDVECKEVHEIATDDIYRTIYEMSLEERASAWFGVAEIEFDPFDPWEVYKTLWEGKEFKSVDSNGEVRRLGKDYVQIEWWL